jgi:hypothetical protein
MLVFAPTGAFNGRFFNSYGPGVAQGSCATGWRVFTRLAESYRPERPQQICQQMRSVTAQRMNALAVQASAYAAGQKDRPAEIVVNVDEKELAKESEQHEKSSGNWTAKLSLKNATAEIRI